MRRNTGVTEFDVRRDFVMDLWRGLCVAGTEMRWDLGFTETGVLPDFEVVECRDFVVAETKVDGIEFRLSLIISPAAVDIEFKFEGIASSFDSIYALIAVGIELRIEKKSSSFPSTRWLNLGTGMAKIISARYRIMEPV